jgi:hypothetical protein
MRTEARNKAFVDEIIEEAAEHMAASGKWDALCTRVRPTYSCTDDEGCKQFEEEGGDDGVAENEEAARAADLEASRRKLAELDRDRPLWEAAARERERREQVEVAQLRARAEARLREAEHAERLRAEAAAREQRAQKEAARRAHEEEATARAEQERRARMQRERWARGPWTPERALERYRQLADAFDARRFSPAGAPLAFADVPWPTLCAPLAFGAEDIDWGTVEAFFAAARARMRWPDYAAFVEKSHRRFHPDRWRSRSVLTGVPDEVERNAMEVAANTVAQALTPLWREAKGR